MFREVGGDLFQPVIGGDNFIILSEELFQQGLLVRVKVGPGDSVGDAVIEIQRAMPSFSPRFS